MQHHSRHSLMTIAELVHAKRFFMVAPKEAFLIEDRLRDVRMELAPGCQSPSRFDLLVAPLTNSSGYTFL